MNFDESVLWKSNDENRQQTGRVGWVASSGERKELNVKAGSHSQNLQLLPGFPSSGAVPGNSDYRGGKP